MEHNGEDRRMGGADHDLLIKINSNVENLLNNFSDHLKDDKESFAKVAKNQEFSNKIIYGGIGVIVFVEFITKVIK